MSVKQKFGDFGENRAEKHLRSKGYKVIARKYRTKLGEIDLIAENTKFLVFCEVKTRTESNWDYGLPFESITKAKIRRIKKSAEFYLLLSPTDKQVRFDVFSISVSNDRLYIDHIENAF